MIQPMSRDRDAVTSTNYQISQDSNGNLRAGPGANRSPRNPTNNPVDSEADRKAREAASKIIPGVTPNR